MQSFPNLLYQHLKVDVSILLEHVYRLNVRIDSGKNRLNGVFNRLFKPVNDWDVHTTFKIKRAPVQVTRGGYWYMEKMLKIEP